MRVAADSWLCVCGVWDKTRRRAERKPQSSPGARSVRWNYLLQQHCSATATTHHGLLIIMHRHITAEYIVSFEHMTVNIHLCMYIYLSIFVCLYLFIDLHGYLVMNLI